MTKYQVNISQAQMQILNHRYPNMNVQSQIQNYIDDSLIVPHTDDDMASPAKLGEMTPRRITVAYLEFYRRFSLFLSDHIVQLSISDILNLSAHPYVKQIDHYLGGTIMRDSFLFFETILAKIAYTGKPQQLMANVVSHEWQGNSPDWIHPTLSKEDEFLLSKPTNKLYTFNKVNHSFRCDWIDPILINNDLNAVNRVKSALVQFCNPDFEFFCDLTDTSGAMMKPKQIIIDKLSQQDLYDSGAHSLKSAANDDDNILLYVALGLMSGLALSNL